MPIMSNKLTDTIFNDKEAISISYGFGLRFSEIRHSHSGEAWLQEACEVFQLTILEKSYLSSDFTITKTERITDVSGTYLIYELALENEITLRGRVSVFSGKDDGLRFLFQLGVDWHGRSPEEIYLHLPFFKVFGKKENTWYLSSNPVSRPDGVTVMQKLYAFDPPICNVGADRHTGFAIDARDAFRNISVWSQNRSTDLIHMTNVGQLIENNLLLRQQNGELADVIDFTFYALDDGWPEAFRRWKKWLRSQMDLSMYERADLKWYRNSLYQHLAFAYSKEIFDYERQRFDPDKLIDDSEAYGGCDLIVLWFVYPRLGVDRRTQWDFAEDMPGGLEGLRQFVLKCHRRGVKVFLPYNPWDDPISVTPLDTADMICRIVRETEIDGIWLDTMDRMPDDFRKRVDEIRPGVVFCLELLPASIHMLEIITGHWDQFFDDVIMPQSCVLRYLFPENNAPITSRWKTGYGKDQFIRRAIFNGTGIAVWQDVFGSWMPFTDEQKALMKTWKEILLAHYDTFFGLDCVPMIPVMQDGLYANMFVRDDRSETIYTVYNAGKQTVDGALLETDAKGSADELLIGGQTCLKDGIVSGAVEPGEVAVICIR